MLNSCRWNLWIGTKSMSFDRQHAYNAQNLIMTTIVQSLRDFFYTISERKLFFTKQLLSLEHVLNKCIESYDCFVITVLNSIVGNPTQVLDLPTARLAMGFRRCLKSAHIIIISKFLAIFENRSCHYTFNNFLWRIAKSSINSLYQMPWYTQTTPSFHKMKKNMSCCFGKGGSFCSSDRENRLLTMHIFLHLWQQQ